jgi:Bacterial Ig domain
MIATRAFALACLMLIGWNIDAVACTGQGFPEFNHQTTDAHVTVRSGKRCAVKLIMSAGPTYSTHIVQRPSHGTAAVTSSNRIVYQSRSGFVGSDSFTYARRGESATGTPTTRTVRILVTVTQ